MKRMIITAILTAALLLSLSTGAMAASRSHGGGGCQGQYFVDADGDGICDNLGTGKGQGGPGKGQYFVDADGDGICDNLGTGKGQGGPGKGEYFVDADGDGTCDNLNTGKGQGGPGKGLGRGNGCGFRGGRNK